MRYFAIFGITLVLAGCATGPERKLDDFSAVQSCYDRDKEGYTPVVDSHIHFRPYGGTAIPMAELVEYFDKTGVRFVSVYGIGQMLPPDSSCTYYLDCPGVPVHPTIRNDFVIAAERANLKRGDVQLTLSMSSPDLQHPDTLMAGVSVYEKNYPGFFRAAGELNLVKQAIFPNDNQAITTAQIDRLGEFMAYLRKHNMPLNVHSDLGNDAEPTKYLHLMERMLNRYPNNPIIWAHMGLSKELKTMDPTAHIRILERLLDKHPNLMLDISWRVLNDEYFSKPSIRPHYIAFMNAYSDRILPGTDFVASSAKNFSVYKDELDITSRILRDLDDEAFENIALGRNYFRLYAINATAPKVCQGAATQ